eukprot:1193800-Prorocentrum_minimum.AAC.5
MCARTHTHGAEVVRRMFSGNAFRQSAIRIRDYSCKPPTQLLAGGRARPRCKVVETSCGCRVDTSVDTSVDTWGACMH